MASITTRSLRVVVADNDRDARDLIQIDLGLEGHDVVGAASDGLGAVELCRTLQPDVLVVDLRMPPGPDGITVARQLRDQPGLRIVVYTNYRDRDAVGAGWHAQVDDEDVGVQQAAQLDGSRAVRRGPDDVVSLEAQVDLDQVARVAVVVGDDDAQRRGRGAGHRVRRRRG